jgi:hypothetical protein
VHLCGEKILIDMDFHFCTREKSYIPTPPLEIKTLSLKENQSIFSFFMGKMYHTKVYLNLSFV